MNDFSKLIICHRAATPGKFSIERVFDSFSRHLPAEIEQETVRVPHAGASIKAMLRNMLFCRKLDKNAVVHVSGDIHYVIPAIRGKKVLTVHDCGSLLKGCTGLRKWLKTLFWIRLPLRYADAVTCISEATRQELLQVYPDAEAKLVVIPDPVGEDFQWAPKAAFPDAPVILHFAKYANKNTLRVIQALNGLSCKLRLIGRLTPETEQALQSVSYPWSIAGDLSDAQLVEEYQNCDVVCFPSLYEGFGMPILEAQAIGQPVLTSNRSPMQDVAGEGALLVDPESVEDIQRGMRRMLTDAALRNQLLQDGKRNVERFRPEAIAKMYMEIYQKVCRS